MCRMSTQRPDVSDEDTGRRTFQLRKARAAERAIDRLRHALGDEWTSYTPREIEELEWLLGEIWAYVHRDDWEELHFGKLRGGDVIKLLGLATQMRSHTRDTVAVLQDAVALVKARD
jgi:hypothetical protein